MRFSNLLCLPLRSRRERDNARSGAVAAPETDPAIPRPTVSASAFSNRNHNPVPPKPATRPQVVTPPKPEPIPPPTPRTTEPPTPQVQPQVTKPPTPRVQSQVTKPQTSQVQPQVAKPPIRQVQLKVTEKRAPIAPPRLDLPAWEHGTIGRIFNVTLEKEVAEDSDWTIVWLKGLATELESEDPTIQRPFRLTADLADRLLVARLEIDLRAASDDLEHLTAIASLPDDQTTFDYLIECWKRGNRTRSELLEKGLPSAVTQQAVNLLDKLRELVVNYIGLALQEPKRFPQPPKREVGPAELLSPLLSLFSLSGPYASPLPCPHSQLSSTEVAPLLQDIAKHFEPGNKIDSILGPVVRALLFHECLFRREGLSGSDSRWRQVIAGLEALVSVKPIAAMITRLDEWNPKNATAASIERVSLMGPLCRLGVFGHEWPAVTETYFRNLDKKTRVDLDNSVTSLRGTLKGLQESLFRIFDKLVRASPESKEAVLQYFARVISLNVRRTGSHVDAGTVATDSFMVNLQTILYRLAEPFMDVNYAKIDRIDPLYLARSTRLDLRNETRIKATSEDVAAWKTENGKETAPPNFISEIFYLSLAMFHYGYQRTIQQLDRFAKHADELHRTIDLLGGVINQLQQFPGSLVGQAKLELDSLRSKSHSFTVQLLDPDHVSRSTVFVTFVSTWIVRFVDPEKKHPSPLVNLPLPQDVPIDFRVLPEFVLEDIVDYLLFILRYSPKLLDSPGKNGLVTFALTFISSTWCIKNPFLKSKLVEMLFLGTLGYAGDPTGVLDNTLKGHPLALKHLMSSLMGFYVEVEQTGASSQFYDKFGARRNIACIFKVIWNSPAHRKVLDDEAKRVDTFVRFANLMINDVTYLMDESLNDLTKIHHIETEMGNTQEWASKPLEYRRERENTLLSLEGHATGYITLGRSTVELLKLFTAKTKRPFMMPEIVRKLGAMLDYNLVALTGPRYQDLKVKNPERYNFSPKVLLGDIIQVFLNLKDEEEFVRAVAEDGRSYKKEVFDGAVNILKRRALKTDDEIAKLRAFVRKVEDLKTTLEEDLGDVPEEFLDALLYTVMKDPVTLPTSRVVVDRATIKAHLLSDSNDPFNRVPLKIEDVIPNPELKARIDEFLATKQAERRGQKVDTK